MRFKTKTKAVRKKRDKFLIFKKKFCRFCAGKVKTIDYKDTKMMESFITERGKILSSRISGNCARHQRRVAKELKKARFISLIPYTR